MNCAHRLFSLLFVLALAARFASAQTPPMTGTPPFGSFGGGPDTINLANLNDHWTIPVFSRAGRGIPFDYNVKYDSSVWYPVGSSGNQTWQPVQNWGLLAQTAVATGYLSMSTSGTYSCYTYIPLNNRWVLTGGTTTWWWNYYVDPWGIQHPLNASSTANWGSCNGMNYLPSQDANVTATDGSGYHLQTHGIAWTMGASTTAWITTREGTVSYPPWNVNAGSGTSTDRNGNQISIDASGNFTDTLGTQALAISGSGTSTSPMVFTYKAPGASGTGTNASVTINYTNYTVATNFGNSTIHEYKSSAVVPLVSSIVLADGSQYAFSYEPTPTAPTSGACTPYAGSTCVTARLASITLPTGGTISYSYYNTGTNNFTACTTGNNGGFSDGSASCLKETTPDGTWTYIRTAGTGAAYTTLVTDPQGNDTKIQFQGIYETQRQTYQGSSSGGTILQTTNTCYNGASSPCTTTAVSLPITRRTELVALPDNTGKVCKHDQFFNTYGLQTEQDDYDYGSGAPSATPLRKVITVYNTALTNGIVSKPASITTCTGAGTSASCNGTGTMVAQTTFAYDETAVVAPTGTSPQHTSITGSRGNATTIKGLIQGTSTFLTKTISYYDTGNPKTVTDVNNAAITYNYLDAPPTCGNAFPTSVSEPLTLTKSLAYNCIGAVQTSVTDENGKITSAAYTDSFFWRPASVTDPSGAAANISYATSSPFNWSESIMTVVSGSSVVDSLTTVDGLGRTRLQQTRQGPSSNNYDTVETDYDSLGRVSRVTLPYSGTSGQTSSTAPATTTTYDALSRPMVATDAGNGTVSYTYTQNDAYISIGPAPSGESAKRRQLEYDALGRLTSVCEVTGGSQSGACGQSNPATGYLTSYTFDVLGDMTGVSQSAQPNGTAQSRSYSFDGLSRLTSETNPESGATNYTYDSATGCTGTYSGDQVKRVDAVGNTTCLAYDLLHRVTSITYPSGPYAASTPAKTLVYDTATVNGVPMTNVKTRLAEAYTGPVGAKITDLGFSYTDRGQISDVYQSTPHSSGYYHLNQTYWPHGGPSQLSQLSGLPTISYGGTIGSTLGLDGEGRITQVTASSGPNPVTGASYNTSNQPTQVTLASGDSDIFAYDPNTLRTTQYKFNVGTQSQSVTGTLTWNANATLAQLAITDQFNSADTQTCNYAHDDLTRIASANCGSAAAQTFSYDPFGNISKSGSPNTFQPTYNAATNRFATIPGTTPSYDANGNVLSDGSHNYAWDADGNSVTLDGVGLTFDALDRMVEQNRSGTYTQIVYAPTGVKLALTSGQTLQKAFVLLPGQATAVYTSTGLDHYRHSDWLGSARLTSSPSRTVLSTAAYAPFGETYAQSGTADLSFTGQNSDTTSGDYDFLFREYSTQGRWTSPDPAGFASVDPSNPQSWNGYAYVTNNPLRLTDPLGLCGQPGETANGPYNYYGGGPCLPLLPPLLGYPCFGFLGVWHSGCPPRAAMPPQAPQKPKSPRQKCLDDTASIDAFLKDVAKARKENLKEGGKRILQAYAFTSIVGCVAGATATGGLGCIPGAKTADAVATPLILSGEALWFLVDQGYDTLKAAIKNTKRAIACNKLTD